MATEKMKHKGHEGDHKGHKGVVLFVSSFVFFVVSIFSCHSAAGSHA
jgi:hypothetical protein